MCVWLGDGISVRVAYCPNDSAIHGIPAVVVERCDLMK